MQKNCLLLVDIEAVCDEVEDESIRDSNREMIEIGAVKVNADTWEVIDTFSCVVQPVVHKRLSAFCKQLLGITQVEVDQADSFGVVGKKFLRWAGEGVSAWASWGQYDAYQWGHDATRHSLPVALPWPHLNLKKEFGRALSMKRRGIGGAYAELGLNMPLERHRALNDAKSVHYLIQHCQPFAKHIQDIVRDFSYQNINQHGASPSF